MSSVEESVEVDVPTAPPTTNAGVVTFHRIDHRRTKVMLQLDFDPEGFVESASDALGVVERRATSDLERFKTFIEPRGAETGAWRGDVPRHTAW